MGCDCKKTTRSQRNSCMSPAVLQINNPSQYVSFHKVKIPASLGDETTNPPSNGKYRNTILEYEATGSVYIYSSDGIPTYISSNTDSGSVISLIQKETEERKKSDAELLERIVTIENSSKFVDVVVRHSDLEAYDTTTLQNNDIVKVLHDETRNDSITYNRWSVPRNSFVCIAEQGPFITKAEVDAQFVPITRKINNKPLSEDIELDPSDIGLEPITNEEINNLK